MSHKSRPKHHHQKAQNNPTDTPLFVTNAEPQSSQNEHEPYCNTIHNHPEHNEKPAKHWASPEGWTGIFTGVLAAFAIGSFILLWIQLDDARKAFTKTQRPYIWVTSNPNNNQVGSPVLEPNKHAEWNFFYGNFGSSPAVRVAVRGQVVFGPQNLRKIQESFFVGELHKGDERNGFVVPPGDRSGYSTARSNEILTAADIAFIKSNDAGIALWIRFEYFDAGGNEYHTNICRFLGANGALAYCPYENTIE